jgi:hypothetical protein
MSIRNGKWRVIVRRVLSLAGLTAASTGIVSVASGGQVFAHQFLQDATPMEIPRMVYSPEQQLMVKPGTSDPVFRYSRGLLLGDAGGDSQTFPLVNCPGDPSCPKPAPPPTNTVTPGGGPNGPGPTADHD